MGYIRSPLKEPRDGPNAPHVGSGVPLKEPVMSHDISVCGILLGCAFTLFGLVWVGGLKMVDYPRVSRLPDRATLVWHEGFDKLLYKE